MSPKTIFIRKLVLTALCGAILNAVKFCLMYIPNVEAVTLLTVVFTYAFGLSVSFPATLVFCVIEGFLWGFNPSWLIAYFIHWPFLSLVAAFCKKLRLSFPLLLALVVAFVTALFGLQSTFVYFLTGGAVGTPGWFSSFRTVYLAGTAFYITQTVCAFVSVTFLFSPLRKLLTSLGDSYFGKKRPL